MTTQPSNSSPIIQPTAAFWLNALIGSTLGIGVGTVSVLILTTVLDLLQVIGAVLLAGSMSGVIAGAIQGGFMRQYARLRLGWLGASSGGWLVHIMVAGAIIHLWSGLHLEHWIGINVLGGTMSGTLQWLVLRRTWVCAIWWVPLNAGIWAAITLGYLLLFGRLIGLASW